MENKKILKDMYKIYLNLINSYKARTMQAINKDYTQVDRLMLTAYMTIYYIESKEVENKEELLEYLFNYMLYPIAFARTGNLYFNEFEIENKELCFYEIENKLIKQFIDKVNNITSKLKINYSDKVITDYNDIIEIFDNIAEILIAIRIYLSGNILVYDDMRKSIKRLLKIYNSKKELQNDSIIKNIVLNFENILRANIDTQFKLKEYLEINLREIYNLSYIVFNLKNVDRFSQVILEVNENVLMHTYILFVFDYILADYMIENGESINKNELLLKSLFHDFTEFTRKELISDFKVYNDYTLNLTDDIERKEEEKLENLIGDKLINIIKSYKLEETGYICDITDKIVGIMKMYIEVIYYSNYSCLGIIKINYEKRLKKFENIERIKNFKNEYFLKCILDKMYVMIIDTLVNIDEEKIKMYYSEEEIEEIKKSILNIKKQEMPRN